MWIRGDQWVLAPRFTPRGVGRSSQLHQWPPGSGSSSEKWKYKKRPPGVLGEGRMSGRRLVIIQSTSLLRLDWVLSLLPTSNPSGELVSRTFKNASGIRQFLVPPLCPFLLPATSTSHLDDFGRLSAGLPASTFTPHSCQREPFRTKSNHPSSAQSLPCSGLPQSKS